MYSYFVQYCITLQWYPAHDGDFLFKKVYLQHLVFNRNSHLSARVKKQATYLTTDISIDLPHWALRSAPTPPPICMQQTNSELKRCRLTGGAGDGVGGAVSLQEVTAGPGEPSPSALAVAFTLGTTVEPLTHFLHAEVLLGAKRRGEEIGARTVLHTNLSAEERADDDLCLVVAYLLIYCTYAVHLFSLRIGICSPQIGRLALVSSAGIPLRQRSPHIDIVHLYKARGIENRHSALCWHWSQNFRLLNVHAEIECSCRNPLAPVEYEHTGFLF